MPIPVPTPAPAPPADLPSSLGALAWGYLPQYVRADDDGTLYALLAALGAPVEADMSVLTDPAYSADEYAIPFARLPWLAAMAGIDLTAIPDARKRAVVADPDYRYRGSATAIRKRVGETLTGAKQVQIVCPYTGDPDAILVRTYAAETPDATVTEAAIRAEVPAWMELTADVAAAGIDYDELASRYATYDDMTTTGKTYDELSQET